MNEKTALIVALIFIAAIAIYFIVDWQIWLKGHKKRMKKFNEDLKR